MAPSQLAESVMASTIGGPAKSTRSVNKAKFMELIDQSKGLLGDLQEHEELRESAAAGLYNPNAAGNEDGEVNRKSPVKPQQLGAIAEEANEGRAIL